MGACGGRTGGTSCFLSARLQGTAVDGQAGPCSLLECLVVSDDICDWFREPRWLFGLKSNFISLRN